MNSTMVDIVRHSSGMLFFSLLLLEPEEYKGGGSFGGVIALFRKSVYAQLWLQQHWLVAWISWDKWNLKLWLTSSQTKWKTSPELTFCWYYRDESASATYYCKKKSVSEPQEESTSNTEKEWIYYRKLKAGEEERCLRHKQVLILGLCSGKWGRSAVFRTN